MASHGEATIIRAADFVKKRRQQARGAQRDKALRIFTDGKSLRPDGSSLALARRSTTCRLAQQRRTVEQQFCELFDKKRFASCYRCFEVQYLLYLAFRDMVSSFRTANAAVNMPWGCSPNKAQLVALRRFMREKLNYLAESCFADSRERFSKTGYAAAAPIYEIHEATGFALNRLICATDRCMRALEDQKRLIDEVSALKKQVSARIDELNAENAQLEATIHQVIKK